MKNTYEKGYKILLSYVQQNKVLTETILEEADPDPLDYNEAYLDIFSDIQMLITHLKQAHLAAEGLFMQSDEFDQK